jgi:2-hydroxy-3-keto-5-methylthiopentenyl-1-phosphate phosphatase
LRDVEIDPAFSRFVKLCHDRGLSVTVLSDGLDIVVETVLRHAGIALPVLANCATATEADRWQLSFPHMRSNCASAAGNCKCAVLATRAPRAVFRADSILVGDGRSDFCGATAAGAVFAKGKLIEHCRATRLRHIPFLEFSDLIPKFATWLHRHSTGDMERASRLAPPQLTAGF